MYGQFGSPQGPADVTDAGGLSPFGTMAQGGNIREWIETASDDSNNSATEARNLRGGQWDWAGLYFVAASRDAADPSDAGSGEFTTGLRIASTTVPEPSSLSLLLVGGAVLMAGRRLRRVKV